MDNADGGEYDDSEYDRNLYRSQCVVCNTVAKRGKRDTYSNQVIPSLFHNL